MSKKAEERAFEAYPPSINEHSVEEGFDWNEEYRDVFQQGYEVAEKDLELTIEDVREIIHIYEITADLLGDELTDDNTQRILNEYNRRKHEQE